MNILKASQSVQFSHSVVSDSLRPHESQHARPPCPSPTPRVHSEWYFFFFLMRCFLAWESFFTAFKIYHLINLLEGIILLFFLMVEICRKHIICTCCLDMQNGCFMYLLAFVLGFSHFLEEVRGLHGKKDRKQKKLTFLWSSHVPCILSSYHHDEKLEMPDILMLEVKFPFNSKETKMIVIVQSLRSHCPPCTWHFLYYSTAKIWLFLTP